MAQKRSRYKINTDYISDNYNTRVRQIIIHYTAGNFPRSLEVLDGKTKRQVSSHYLINDIPTKKHKQYIYRLVDENLRSWHAGVSEWRGDMDLNNSSIKVDLNRLGYKFEDVTKNSEDIDEEYTSVVKAFQRHFVPEKVDGEMSLENYIILKSLLKKYNTESLYKEVKMPKTEDYVFLSKLISNNDNGNFLVCR